jgi:membrane-associated phospholipid phosphatase
MISEMKHITMVAPLLTDFAAFIIPLFTGNLKDFDFFLLLTLANVVNHFLKHSIFKAIMGNDTYPIIGRGTRPDGAMDAGLFEYNKPAVSYGMPSGHAQSVTIFVTYLITNRILKGAFNNLTKIISSLILVLFALMVMYGRVELSKVHTLQQVICGSLFGICIVMIYNKMFKK